MVACLENSLPSRWDHVAVRELVLTARTSCHRRRGSFRCSAELRRDLEVAIAAGTRLRRVGERQQFFLVQARAEWIEVRGNVAHWRRQNDLAAELAFIFLEVCFCFRVEVNDVSRERTCQARRPCF